MTHLGNHSYQGYSHEQLITMLKTADPQDRLSTHHAVAWQQLDDALGQLSQALNDTVINGQWTGPAAEEFQRRLSSTAEAAGGAAGTANQMWQGLDYLAGDIATAKRAMPDVPSRNVLNPNAVEPDGTVGASQGFVQAIAARKQAGDKAATVMDDLGRSMQSSTEYWWPQQVPPSPAGLPGTPASQGVLLHRSTVGPGPAMPPGTGYAATPVHHAGPTGPVGTVRVDLPGDPGALSGTSLAGAGVGTVAGLPVTGLTAPSVGVAAAPTGLGATPVLPGVAGSGLASAPLGPGTPRLTGGVPAEPLPVRAGTGVIGAGGTGRTAGDPEEYRTWRTEDDLVWQHPHPAPPPVID